MRKAKDGGLTMKRKLWLVPLTVTVTAYVDAPDDRDAETIQNIAQDAVGLHSLLRSAYIYLPGDWKTFGVILEHNNIEAGEAVESVVQ